MDIVRQSGRAGQLQRNGFTRADTLNTTKMTTTFLDQCLLRRNQRPLGAASSLVHRVTNVRTGDQSRDAWSDPSVIESQRRNTQVASRDRLDTQANTFEQDIELNTRAAQVVTFYKVAGLGHPKVQLAHSTPATS